MITVDEEVFATITDSAMIVDNMDNKKKKKKIYNMKSDESCIGGAGAGSRQVAGRSMLTVNELGYEVRLEVAL